MDGYAGHSAICVYVMVHKSQFQSNQVPKYIPKEDVHNSTLVLCFIPYGLPKVQLPYI
jgi:hypothetical protein